MLQQDFDKVSFTADIWSDSSSGVSLLSLTCHITADFQRKNIVLKAEVLEERHTGDYISEVFQSMLKEWGIQKQNVHCMVRDGGSNMKRACSLSEIHNVDCTAHQLHLVVKEAIKNVDTISVLLGKCRKIAGHFNHSTMAKQELEKIQVRLNQKVLKVLQDSPTRWNSSYHMLERLDCIKDSLSLYALNNKIEQFNADDWTLIQDLVKVLKPLDDVTKTLSSQNSYLETEENLTATTSTGVKPTIRKEHSQSLDLEVSIANMLDSDDDDEQSENQMSDTKANLLTEYMSEKRLPRDQDQLKYWQINSKREGRAPAVETKTDLMMMMIRKISARKDKKRSGPLEKFEDEKLEELLDQDRCQTLTELGKPLQVDESTVSKRLKDLGMIQKQGHWAPYELKLRDVERHFLTCEPLLNGKKEKVFCTAS
ncbi:Zinc finger BED domain-containing protein 4 [Eumeta japonica]|uniref:Zinc finger BED domain-containing protein 4 n=1 Tax=Eumeta variegata TaxID=151549 RepID=A0A4C1Y7S0_EUMVA|nr:Zinc finger BED domain-containing protein 4 [Eumeta japonica]